MSAGRQTGNESATLGDVILNAIRADRLELNTAMPAEVKSYNSALQTCTVQPAFKRIYIRNQQYVSRAEIDDVPVMFPRAGSYSFTYPIESGTPVLLIFSQRSLDDWADLGGEVSLTDSRLHNINDAIAIPGLYPTTGAMIPPPLEASAVNGPKVFVGDPTGITTGVTTAVGSGATPGAPAAVSVPPGKLDLLQILESFITIVKDSWYGGVAVQGGGGAIQADAQIALQTLLTELGGLKA